MPTFFFPTKTDLLNLWNQLQLIELEKKLKEENKSRNKAEKKLKYLMKKLESMNISYVSDESEHSSLFDKSEISSVTFSEDKEQSSQFQDSIGSTKCSSEVEHSQEHISQEKSINFKQNALQIAIFRKDDDNNSKGREVLGKSSELDFSNSDSNRYVSCLNSTFKILHERNFNLYIRKSVDLSTIRREPRNNC